MESMGRWLFLISVLLVSSLQKWVIAAAGKPQVPCYFIFGDSLSDAGNNNKRYTLAKVNYKPYGIDFPKGPTGRFSNGRTMHDVIVELLGFQEYIVPFSNASGNTILNGVNYASGAAGILDESGKKLGSPVTMNEQIINHITITSRLSHILGNDSSTKLLNQCIYSIQIGSNDFINNYFKPKLYTSSAHYTLEVFSQLLVERLSNQIKTLHDNGARKFAIYGLGQIGCTPYAIALYGTKGAPCVGMLNNASISFNNRLKSLVDVLNRALTDSKFTYLSPTPSEADISSIAVLNASCCKAGGGGGELCLPNTEPCINPRQYVFWDAVHPTEAWNFGVGKSAYQTVSPLEAHPYNIQTLAMK